MVQDSRGHTDRRVGGPRHAAQLRFTSHRFLSINLHVVGCTTNRFGQAKVCYLDGAEALNHCLGGTKASKSWGAKMLSGPVTAGK